MTLVTTVSEQRCFDGRMGFYSHRSVEIGADMRFAIYMPPQADWDRLPAVYYLAGLTCTEETFFIKAGAQRFAAEHGLILIAPDTSPRGLGIPGETDAWDFGAGAGFYLDAIAEPWARNYRMGSYVSRELPALIEAHFPVRTDRRGIFGHSMGGHGALVLALRNPGKYQAVSAFAPIARPSIVPWGQKAFSRYLGPDKAKWMEYDASELMRRVPFAGDILVDQGDADQFLRDQLLPQELMDAAGTSGQRLTLRRHAGYDHSYYFVQSFIADHIIWHAQRLNA